MESIPFYFFTTLAVFALFAADVTGKSHWHILSLMWFVFAILWIVAVWRSNE